MKKYKKNLVSKSIAIGLVVWLMIGIGLGAAETVTGRLTLSLQSSLDGGGDIKATAITKAELLGPDGAVVMKTATITGGTAQFNLSGVQAGDYFIRVNDLADDLVPTRIDDATKDIIQSVGQKLRVAVIGSLSDPIYNIKTYSKGQGEHPVVKYSDGTNVAPERYVYAIVSLKTSPQKLEVRVLGTTRIIPTAALLNSYTHTASPHPFATWILLQNNHGKDANYGGNDSKCNTCHGSLDMKPATYSEVKVNNGWCYKCHYGKGGDPNGFIDITFSESTATPTTPVSTPKATTAVPTATPKTPAFEALFAIAALLVALLVRKK